MLLHGLNLAVRQLSTFILRCRNVNSLSIETEVRNRYKKTLNAFQCIKLIACKKKKKKINTLESVYRSIVWSLISDYLLFYLDIFEWRIVSHHQVAPNRISYLVFQLYLCTKRQVFSFKYFEVVILTSIRSITKHWTKVFAHPRCRLPNKKQIDGRCRPPPYSNRLGRRVVGTIPNK